MNNYSFSAPAFELRRPPTCRTSASAVSNAPAKRLDSETAEPELLLWCRSSTTERKRGRCTAVAEKRGAKLTLVSQGKI
jgi:hypothetical protein